MPVETVGFVEWLFLNLRRCSQMDKVAQIFADDGTEWTFSKLFEDSVHAAVGLPEIGVKQGDVVAVVLRNSHELFSFTIGCFMAGIKLVPMITELSADDLASGFRVAKPTHVLTAPQTVPTVEEAIRLSGLSPSPRILALTHNFYNEIIAKGSHVDCCDYRPLKIADPTTHSSLTLFSSGTTGPPKAIAISDRNLYVTIENSRESIVGFTGPMLDASQCNWVSWILSLGRSLYIGRCRVFMNKVDIKRILEAIHKHKVESWYAPPRVILALEKAVVANPGAWDISSLKLIASRGDILKEEIQGRLIKNLNCPVHQEYGSTEGGFLSLTDVNKPIVLGSIGKPCVRVKLVDTETGESILEPHKTGELYIHARDVIILEIQGKGISTADAFIGDWMPTGDLMFFDENGNYFMVERIKEIFKYNGYQVSPSELEMCITQIPDVLEVAVVGKPDPNVGEYPAAVIVKRPGSELTADDVHNFLLKWMKDEAECISFTCQCLIVPGMGWESWDVSALYSRDELPDWKKLRGGITFVDELPKTASGKIIRRKLRDIVEQKN